jgi:hypothetical protein
MRADFFGIFVDTVLTDTPDLTNRLGYQTEALDELECIAPVIGQWIDEFGAEHLLSIFALDDKRFAKSFPKMAMIGWSERRRMLNIFTSHLDHCAHCSLRRSYDIELQGRIDRMCHKNRDWLLQLLDDSPDEQTAEGEHQAHDLASLSSPTSLRPERLRTDRCTPILASLVEGFQET